MPHLQHILKNKKNLDKRFAIIKATREFFWQENFIEVDTPLILQYPGQEPYLSPMELSIHDEKNKEFRAFLLTSPEYALKKMICAGYKKIFNITKCFRDYESFGGTHNPEFTMIEWYRTQADMFDIMDDVEKFTKTISKKITPENNIFKKWKRVSMRELWRNVINVELNDYLTSESMFKLCKKMNFLPSINESYEDLFYRIFLNKIEPSLSELGAVFIYNYPAQMAALSKLSKDKRYAERFEVYVNGIELANAFSELTNAEEQLKRLQKEYDLRKKTGKVVYNIDMNFINALKNGMPKSAGIALGIDRLAQIILNCKNIDDVLVLPMAVLFD